MKFSVFQISRKGGRENNEDRMGYCYTRASGLFVLADGMGGTLKVKSRRNWRCNFALRVAAHAVGQHKQTRLAGIAITHAIFVFFASTAATDLKDGKFHLKRVTALAAFFAVFLVSDTMLSNCNRTFSLTLSLV